MDYSSDILGMLGRTSALFERDLTALNSEISQACAGSRFLVIGGAGSIGQAVTRELFKRNPATLHVVDTSENNMVELVRDIRSTIGYKTGDFRTFAVDCSSVEFDALFETEGPYDYILNLAALKHVRSEKDPYTLMRMIDVNVFNTVRSITKARSTLVKNYFCVSTDKAANPVNLMGASKLIMEMFVRRESISQNVSMARFANVAFSDGSLLHGFNQRMQKRQPITAPRDVRRYFITPQESGELCLLSCLFGENRDIFFPKLCSELRESYFSDIAVNFLERHGFEAFECSCEDEARSRVAELLSQRKWPCYFFESDTTGEKDIEEFFTADEVLDLNRFQDVGVIKNNAIFDDSALEQFTESMNLLRERRLWTKQDILQSIFKLIPEFAHKETGKYLDSRM